MSDEEEREVVAPKFALWIDIIEAAVSVEQPGYVREAAASALLHSEAYKQLGQGDGPEAAASQRCRIWLAVLTLMEDEDEDIRAIASVFTKKHATTSSDTTSSVADDLSLRRLETALASDLVDCGLDRSKNGGLGHILRARNALLMPLSVLRELAGQGKAHNEKVFEEEQDNLYAEPAVLLATLNGALVRAGVEGYSRGGKELLDTLCDEASAVVTMVTELHTSGSSESFSMSGGITFQRDLYLHCYSALQCMAVYGNSQRGAAVHMHIEKLRRWIEESRPAWHPKLLELACHVDVSRL